MRNKRTLEVTWFFFNLSPICLHNFSFQTISLHFLFDMSYISSHLRTNSINFSSISEEKTGSTRCKQTLQVQWRRRKTVHIIGIEKVQAGSDPFRHVKHSRLTTATERNWDVTETFPSMWTSPFDYTWESFTERWRSATERNWDVTETFLSVWTCPFNYTCESFTERWRSATGRNGTETWRRLSCQYEHLHLITHEKILLNGDVPRRNGTETWRRRSCQCEHFRLIIHEKILLNGDVPRRNGTETLRRRSCQCEHLRLITHEKILLIGDVPRRNGTETWRIVWIGPYCLKSEGKRRLVRNLCR